ncbi:immunoglobulin-like domain-containing protein [Amedibacillus sp. YH-ame6]
MKKHQYLIFLILVSIICGGVYLYFNRKMPNSELSITFKEVRKVETGANLDPIDLIASTSSAKILYPKIDTSISGKKKLLYIAVGKDGYQKEFMTELNVIDPTPPELVLSQDTVTITVGDTFDAKSYVQKAYDSFDGKLKVDISKDYDISLPGSYLITYRVIDSSKNITEKSLTLIVKDKEKPLNNNNGNQNNVNEESNNNPNITPSPPSVDAPSPSYNGQTIWLFENDESATSAQSKCESAGINSGRRWTCSVMNNDLGIHIGFKLNIN